MKRQHLLQLGDNKYYFKRMCTPAWSQRLSYTFVLWILQALTALYSNIPRTEELNGFQKGSCCPKHKDDVDTYINFCEVQLQRMKSLLFKNFADEKHAGFVGTLCKHRSSTSEDFANNVSLSPDLIFFFYQTVRWSDISIPLVVCCNLSSDSKVHFLSKWTRLKMKEFCHQCDGLDHIWTNHMININRGLSAKLL